MRAQAYLTPDGQLRLRRWVDRHPLWQAMQSDGRYRLATHDGSLSTARMLELYRSKDGIEKRFAVAQQDLKVSPLYGHSDERIKAMRLLNRLALLVYRLLERQVQRHGLQLTTRRVIERWENLSVIETQCWDGSVLVRLTPLDAAQAQRLVALQQITA